MDVIYYECHVTIEPVFDERLDKFKRICEKYKFRAADLFLQKRKEDLPTRSSKDSFCTSKGLDFEEIKVRMKQLVEDLRKESCQVWRQKIEAVILDDRFGK